MVGNIVATMGRTTILVSVKAVYPIRDKLEAAVVLSAYRSSFKNKHSEVSTMPNVIQVQYNPYIPRLSVLVNGKQPSEFSQLIQYTDEDIWQWGPSFLDTLYSELRDDFYISFIGSEQDANVIRFLCAKHEHCRGVQATEFSVTDSLQVRMKKLNQHIKSEQIMTYCRSVVDAVFMLSANTQSYMEDISDLDINNLFCSVRVSTIGIQKNYEEKENSFLFFLVDGAKDNLNFLNFFEKWALSHPAFVIVLGSENELKDVTASHWIYATTEDRLFDTIFACFLQMPLLLAFRQCIQSLSKSKPSRQLKKIACVEPMIDVDVEGTIEAGKSVKISISLDPPGKQIPDLIYKVRNQKIASCDGMCVYGLQEGTSVLEVYRSGEKSPFFEKEISVYKRNRIVRLILSDDNLVLGLNDRKVISCDYAPKDADNVNDIRWRSSDPSVVKVDGRGRMIASGLGQCRIICTAENAAAQCLCTVKPYLSNISVDVPLEENILRLEPMDEYQLSIDTSPKDCIDDKIVVETSDYNVVNVVNYTLYAKNCGNAVITVRNINGRISQTFSVVVAKQKVGFLKKIFGNH